MLRILLALTASAFVYGAVPSKPAPVSDGVVEAAIRAKFAKSKINEEHFKVSVRNGVAVLEGKTAVPQRKGAATRLAKTGGAREVVNKIEVSEAARKQMADRLQKARDRRSSAPKTPASQTPPPAKSPEVAAAPQAPAPALRRMQIKQ
jgi:hypothetical protein